MNSGLLGPFYTQHQEHLINSEGDYEPPTGRCLHTRENSFNMHKSRQGAPLNNLKALKPPSSQEVCLSHSEDGAVQGWVKQDGRSLRASQGSLGGKLKSYHTGLTSSP